MNPSFVRRWPLAILTAGIAAACAGGSDAPKVPLGQRAVSDSAPAVAAAHSLLGSAAKAALDSGNAFFRKKAYDAALAKYREASELAPQHAAPLFGIYMVARAMNNSVMADSALAGIRLRNGPVPATAHSFKDTVLQRAHVNTKTKA